MRIFVSLIVLVASNAAGGANVAGAQSALSRGRMQLITQTYGAAILSCKQGIAEIGDSYQYQDVIDDTGQKLVLADLEENNNPSASANLYCNVLESRISQYKWKIKKGSGKDSP